MEKECFITKWNIYDYQGRRKGKQVVFQNEILTHCKGLNEWVRWGKYLIRYKDVLWFCGYEKMNYMLPSIDNLLILFNKYINDKDLVERAKSAEEYTGKYRGRYYYSKFRDLTKKQLDLIPESEINSYFKNASTEHDEDDLPF